MAKKKKNRKEQKKRVDLSRFDKRTRSNSPEQRKEPSNTPAVASVVDGLHEGLPSTRAVIYRSELDFISRCILDYPNIETGGQLFGFWTARGVPVVLYAIGPGPRANHESTFFNQDLDYLKTVGNTIIARYGLEQIGEWHSHHRLGLAQPSAHDSATVFNSVRRHHLRRWLLCIGNCDATHTTVNAFSYHEDHIGKVVHAKWQLKNLASPFRTLIDNEMRRVVIQPRTLQASHGPMNMVVDDRPAYQRGYWLSQAGNGQVLQRIIDAIKKSEPTWWGTLTVQVKPQLDRNGHVHLMVARNGRNEDIYFPENFPNQGPRVTLSAGKLFGSAANPLQNTKWEFNGDIYDSFMHFYEQVKTDSYMRFSDEFNI